MKESQSNASNRATHRVENQSPLYVGFDAWQGDRLLQAICTGMPNSVIEDLQSHGRWAGQKEVIELGRLANSHPPQLKTHDSRGNRIDQVEYHPAYHALMRHAINARMHNSTWDKTPAEEGMRNKVRAARYYLSAGVEAGHLCPITMTNASATAISSTASVAREWLPKIQAANYDPGSNPPMQKAGVTIGMAMTEKQGGSDVRANTSFATDAGDGLWRLGGHKWFMSAPMSDGFVMLAQTALNGTNQQPSCFLVPRILPDGRQNGLFYQRLKDKMGNRSNASVEVEFDGAVGHLLGEQGAGIATILNMVTLTRLDCAVASAGLMRAALAEAVHHCRHRSVFGDKLIDKPLMNRVLADMALDVAAATALAMRLAQAYDNAPNDPAEAAYARLMTPVIKYWVCKICPALVYEAMECLGGNGYVEEGNLARHYREAPLNAIWEGSGNVMCLDVMRVNQKNENVLTHVLTLLERDLGEGAAKTIDVIRTASGMTATDPGSGRIFTEQLALTAAAAELRRLRLGGIADAFIETRLGGLWRSTYGMLDNRYDVAGMLDWCYPSI